MGHKTLIREIGIDRSPGTNPKTINCTIREHFAPTNYIVCI